MRVPPSHGRSCTPPSLPHNIARLGLFLKAAGCSDPTFTEMTKISLLTTTILNVTMVLVLLMTRLGRFDGDNDNDWHGAAPGCHKVCGEPFQFRRRQPILFKTATTQPYMHTPAIALLPSPP
eukprot:859615-Rhodomonas_salina.2